MSASPYALSRCVECSAQIHNGECNPCSRCRVEAFIRERKPLPPPPNIEILDQSPREWDWGPRRRFRRFRRRDVE